MKEYISWQQHCSHLQREVEVEIWEHLCAAPEMTKMPRVSIAAYKHCWMPTKHNCPIACAAPSSF